MPSRPVLPTEPSGDRPVPPGRPGVVPSDRHPTTRDATWPLWGVVVAAALVIVGVGLKSTASIIGPTFLALTLVITFQPLRRVLVTKARMPGWFSTVVVLLAIYGALLVVLGSVVLAIGQLATTLPSYTSSFVNLYNNALAQLSDLGVGQAQLTSMLSSINVSSFTGIAQTLLSSVSSGLSLIVLLVTVIIFLAADAAGFDQRLDRIRRQRSTLADAFGEFARRVRSYWIVTSVFGLIVAVIDVIALWIIGVPLALTWGVLAFVTNYIPNVGFVLGVIPPALIALLDGGLGPMIAVIVSYCVVNFVVQTLIQPRFTGDAAGVNPSIAFLSLIFWAYLLGALGALLAIPATLFVKATLINANPRAQWFAALIDTDEEHRKKRKQDKRSRRSPRPTEREAEPADAAG